jgi:hypothetical protein
MAIGLVKPSAFSNKEKIIRRQSSSLACAWTIPTGTWDTCAMILGRFVISLPKFHSLNPSVGSDCSLFVGGTDYCVAGSMGFINFLESMDNIK